MSVKLLPSGRWRLQIRRKNLHVDKVFDTEHEAREAERKHLTVQKPQHGVTLEDAWPLYVASLMHREKKARTRDTEISRIKRMLRLYGKRPIASITSNDVKSYIVSRMDDKASADAIRLEVAALSALMTYACSEHWIAANPCIGVSRPAGKIKIRRMTREQEGGLIELLRHENLRFRSAARLCLLVRETGARPGEWNKATYDDVDLEREKVTFQNTKYRNEPRTVPLTKTAVRLLTEQLEDVMINNLEEFGGSNLLFPAVGNDGEIRPMHYTGAIRDAKKHELLPKSVRAHNGRHEYISTVLEETDLEDARLMALVGHHSYASMAPYAHLRNTRFLPQVEGIEGTRRSQRIQSLANSLGIPTKLIESFLNKARAERKRAGDKDGGEELLYTREALDELHALVDKLGATPDERRPNLAKILNDIASKRSQAPIAMEAEEKAEEEDKA